MKGKRDTLEVTVIRMTMITWQNNPSVVYGRNVIIFMWVNRKLFLVIIIKISITLGIESLYSMNISSRYEVAMNMNNSANIQFN